MPFRFDISYDDTQLGAPLPPAATLHDWRQPQGCIVEPGDSLFVLDAPPHSFEVRTRFCCFLDRCLAQPGQRLVHGTPVATVIADGEEIPEGFRYCTTVELR